MSQSKEGSSGRMNISKCENVFAFSLFSVREKEKKSSGLNGLKIPNDLFSPSLFFTWA